MALVLLKTREGQADILDIAGAVIGSGAAKKANPG